MPPTQLLQFLQRRDKPLSGASEQGQILPHETTNHIDRTEQHIRMARTKFKAFLANSPHKVFDVMSQVADGLESDRIGGPFQRVCRAEQLAQMVSGLAASLSIRSKSVSRLSRYLSLRSEAV